MIQATVRRVGDKLLFEISPDEATHLSFEEGQKIELTFVSSSENDISDEALDEMIDDVIKNHRDALDYLAR